MMEPQDQIKEEDQENVEVAEEGKNHSLFNAFSETSSFTKDTKEAINVCASLKNEGAAK